MTLLSTAYQQRLAHGVEPLDSQRQAMRDWQTEITQILSLPKKDRPTELELHEHFFTVVFERALGYAKRRDGFGRWTIQSEYITDVDKTRPDGVLGFFSDKRSEENVQAVIELKGPGADLDLRQNREQDRRTPVDQAFSYAHKFDAVQWVIVSNYQELRLYHQGSSKYALHFDLTTLATDDEHLKLFFRLLSRDNLISETGPSVTTELYTAREEELRRISAQFSRDSRDLRLATAESILRNNGSIPIERAVTLAQTIVDRLVFIAFLEDLGLIPGEMIEKAYDSQNAFAPASRWQNFQGLFRALERGEPSLSIPAYGGSLFRANPEMDGLRLDDDLFTAYKTLANYDFLSDLRVDILGTVFEQSITDIETLKARLRGEGTESDRRRHDEGAYCTPKDVTSYIVQRTVAATLKAARTELGWETLPEISEDERRTQGNISRETHLAFWRAYGQRLKDLRIVDPSVGSGAFLIETFDTLASEGVRIDKELARLDAPPCSPTGRGRWFRPY
ncbi:hypothetical protein [Rhodospirillum sp. A1_3_36]|uniref:hypothetical protein n=1 Tax=Rhodospirillum sp. A1_3_36 TaxID=3391666 RepID=UPI0039A540A3